MARMNQGLALRLVSSKVVAGEVGKISRDFTLLVLSGWTRQKSPTEQPPKIFCPGFSGETRLQFQDSGYDSSTNYSDVLYP